MIPSPQALAELRQDRKSNGDEGFCTASKPGSDNAFPASVAALLAVVQDYLPSPVRPPIDVDETIDRRFRDRDWLDDWRYIVFRVLIEHNDPNLLVVSRHRTRDAVSPKGNISSRKIVATKPHSWTVFSFHYPRFYLKTCGNVRSRPDFRGHSFRRFLVKRPDGLQMLPFVSHEPSLLRADPSRLCTR